MYNVNHLFVSREMNVKKLLAYGFRKDGQDYGYRCDVMNKQFTLQVNITTQGDIAATIIDKVTGEDYILHRITSATGAFVGQVREEHDAILLDIAENCFPQKHFKTAQADAIVQHLKQQYQTELEFLWPRFPENAIFRRKDNQKWFGALLTIHSSKLGRPDDSLIEIVNIKVSPQAIASLVDGEVYFPGYHMNKKHWVTLCLDGSVPTAEVLLRINNSFNLAG